MNARRWQSVGEVLLCSGFPTQLALSGLLRIAGVAPLGADARLSAPFVFALSIADTALLIGLMTWLLFRRGERPREVFFGSRPPGREAALGAGVTPFIAVVVVVLLGALRLLAPSLHNVPDNPLEALLRTPAGFAATLLVVIVAGGVREELQRAFLLHRFDQDLGGSMAGLAITSVAFGLGHTLQGRDVAVTTGVLGWLWGALTLARGGAVASMTSHALFNSLELARALAQP